MCFHKLFSPCVCCVCVCRPLGALHQGTPQHSSHVPAPAEVWAWPCHPQNQSPPWLQQSSVEGGLHGKWWKNGGKYEMRIEMEGGVEGSEGGGRGDREITW